MGFRLYLHDLTIYKPVSASSTVRDVADSITVDFYRRGAWANAVVDFAAGVGGALAVIDPGDIVVGDTVQIGTSTTATRDITGVTATSITLGTGGGGQFTTTNGVRIVVTASNTASPPPYPRPRTYTDESGTEETTVDYQITTDSKGEALAYTYNRVVDLIADAGGTPVLITDHGGTGGGNANGPEQWGALGNDSTDNIDAFDDLIQRVDGVESGGIIEIPAGTFRLGSVWTINTVAGLTIRGAGREQTILKINHTGTGIDFTGSCSDVTIEGLTIQRIDGTKTADIIQISSASLRTTVRDIVFKNGGIAVDDQGSDTLVSECWFTGSDWVSFVRLDSCDRPLLKDLTAVSTGNWTRGIDIDSEVVNPKLSNVNISSSDGTVAGIGIHIRDTLTTTEPRGILISNCNVFNGPASVCMQIDAGESVIVSSTELSDGLHGVVIDGGNGITFSNCISVGHEQHSFDINAIADVTIIGLQSSDISMATDNTYNHIDIAANINNVMVMGCRFGDFIRSSGQSAAAGIKIAAGTSNTITVVGNQFNTQVTDDINSASTVNVIDYSHNMIGGILYHSIAGGTGDISKVTLSGTEATQDARGIVSVTFSQSGATTFTDFTSGEKGQRIYCMFTDGDTTIQDLSNGSNIQLVGGADFVGSANDVLVLIHNGSDWLEVSRSVN